MFRSNFSGIANLVKRLILPNSERRGLLGLMKATHSKREYRRASAILEKANGLTYKAIADKHGVDVKTVQRWVEVYPQTIPPKPGKLGESSQTMPNHTQ